MKTRSVVRFALLLAVAAVSAAGQSPAPVHYLEITDPPYNGRSAAYRPNCGTYAWGTLPGVP
jgi:hypothetical protein